MHLDGKLENIIDTLALSLSLVYVVAPDVSAFVSMLSPVPLGICQDSHSMSPDQNRVGVWVFLHSFLQAFPQVLLVCCVLDNGYP
jgi:hypothetical protein